MEGLLTRIAIALHIMSPAAVPKPAAPTRPATPISAIEPTTPRANSALESPSTARVYWTEAYYAQEDEENNKGTESDHKG